MGFSPFGQAALPALTMQATTGTGGYTLVNGTGTVISWTAPSDGQLHVAMAFGSLVITSPETGGTVNFSAPLPAGGTANDALFNAGQAAGNQMGFGPAVVVPAGGTVTVNQATALTAGAATLYAEIWGY